MLCAITSSGEVVRISSGEDFSVFVSNVSKGANYSGTTVYLDSDLSLPEITEPIDNFVGTFDGQGHIINDLEINSSASVYAGLFGHSSGLFVGGIAGHVLGPCYTFLQNCLNHGPVTHSGATEYTLEIGGIAGRSTYSRIENSVSAGKITMLTIPSMYADLGGIVGLVESETSINHCYYTSGVEVDELYGYAELEPSTAGTPTTSSDVDLTLVGNLNSRVTSDNGLNRWLFNGNSVSVSFVSSSGEGFTVSSQIILLPSFVSSELTFNGWYEDSSLTVPFSSSSVSGSVVLYAQWTDRPVLSLSSILCPLMKVIAALLV